MAAALGDIVVLGHPEMEDERHPPRTDAARPYSSRRSASRYSGARTRQE